MFRPLVVLAAVLAVALALLPYLAGAFFGPVLRRWVHALPLPVRFLAPGVLCVPYLLVSLALGSFAWRWACLYAGLPIAFAATLAWADRLDPEQRGTALDYIALLVLGLAVDLRWFEPAWPHVLSVFNKVLLLDAGIYGLLFVRRLEGVGFDLRLRWNDLRHGLREWVFYAPMAIPLGLLLRFLHFHRVWPRPGPAMVALVFTFLFIAVPEELFFRGWLQNLLMRRMRAGPALVITSMIFGLAHWNKRAAHFNWRYVLLASLAGIFYGRAWMAERRVAASAVTHTCVDTLWSLFLR